MQLPNWSRNLLLRRRRKRERAARQELFAPVRLSLRKLEERRVLDVSAAFMAGSGVLELNITDAGEVATIQDSGGNVSIRDSGDDIVDINGSGAPPVAWADVKRIEARGDAAPGQEIVFDTPPLSLADGLQVEDSIESATLTDWITSGASIEIQSDLVLENDILLVGTDLTFGGTIDSQPNALHSLTINAGAGSVSFNGDLGAAVPLRGLDVQRADGGVTFGESLPVQNINSTGTISIGSSSVIGGTGVAFNAGTNATVQVNTTNDDVTINGATELQSNLSINTDSNRGDITFTGLVESESGEFNDLTLAAGDGSVVLKESAGQTNALGKFEVMTARGGVTFGEDTLPLSNVLRANNGIDIGVGSNFIGGAGIVFQGAPHFLSTEGGNIRLNGAVMLNTDTEFSTGTGGGDVVFTNDAPIDSSQQARVVIRTGQGAVRVNEDIGREGPLRALTILTDGEVFLGESRTETPGSGGRGPVEVIHLLDDLDLGLGVEQGPSRTVITGSATEGALFTVGNAGFLGPVELATDLTITSPVVSGSAGGVFFARHATVDSASGVASSLTLDVASVVFEANIGSIRALNQFIIVDAARGVGFGRSPAISSSNGPVNLVRTLGPIDIGVGSNVIGRQAIFAPGGISLEGGDAPLRFETNNSDVRFNGAILARSDVIIDTGDGGGDILLASDTTIDSADTNSSTFGSISTDERNSLTLDAGTGSISLNANIGDQQRLHSLTIARADGGVSVGGADTSTVGGTGPVTQVAADGPISIGSMASITGGIVFNGGGNLLAIETSADNIAFNGPTELRSDVSVNTGPGGGDLTLSALSTVNSQAGEANGLSIAVGTGNATLGASVGGIRPLDELRIVSAMNVTAQSEVHAASIVQQAGSGTTTFGGSVNTTDPSLFGLDLTGNGFVFHGPVKTTGDGSVSIVHAGLLDIRPLADMRLEGAFHESGTGSVEIAADIVTSGDEIHFASPVTLTDGAAADVLLDTTAGGNAAGAAIVFDETVDAQQAGVKSLTLNAGSAGDIIFDAAVGDASRVGQLRIIEANDVVLSGALTTTNIAQDAGHGTTTFNGIVDTNSDSAKAIDISTVNVSFLGAVTTTGDGRVELSVTGVLDLAAAADMNLSGALLQEGGGEVRTSADITTSDDDITFTDEVILRASVRFDTGPGAGNLLFMSTLDGTNDCLEDLTLALGAGNALFQDAVGGSVGLGDVLVENAADVHFASSLLAGSMIQTAGSGETRFDGPVTIKTAAGVDLTAGSVTINAAFDTSAAGGPIEIAASDDIAVNSPVTAGSATVGLSAGDDVLFSGHGSIATVDADVGILADADASMNGGGGSMLMTDGAFIAAGSGVIDIGADENIQLGRLVTTTLVRLTSTSGAIVDGGNAGGADIVADRLALRSHTGVGTANPIDTSVNAVAAKNERAGGVRIENANGGALTIGSVDGLSGVMNGPIAAPEKLVGEVEIIHVGAIDVKAPILNDGGSHTIVRAELPGDLTIDAPLQNRGGNGWIFLFSGGDLLINHSLPEPQAEISVENEGAIRGEAIGDVVIDNSATEYVIIRTHSERFSATDPLPTLSPKFADPARYPPATDTAFYTELEAELQAIRNSISAQATNFPGDPISPMSPESRPFFDIEPVDQGGSDIDSNGRGIVKITIGDGVHLETNWHFTIDWGDGTIESYTIPGNPQASLGFLTAQGLNTNQFPDLTNTPRIDSGVGGEPGVYFVHHKYLAPPNPSDPSAPIPISATLRYDAREEGEQALDIGRPTDGSVIFNGIRFFQNGTEAVQSVDQDILTSPGQGAFGFIKVVESVIIPVESRQVTTVYVVENSTATTAATSGAFEFVVVSYEAEAFEEYRLFMRVVDDVVARAEQAQSPVPLPHAGEGDQEYPLKIETLDDPLKIFRERKFPNGHYRIYLEEVRTGRERLILEVYIYEGRVVPENFREGAAERPPGSGDAPAPEDGSQLKVVTDPLAVSQTREPDDPSGTGEGETAIVRAAALDPGPEAETPDNATDLHRSSVLLPAAAAALPWGSRVRQALRSETRSISRAALRLRRHR